MTQYAYDAASDLVSLTDQKSDTTQWDYDSYRGFLTTKMDATGNGASYTYTAAGRLASRTWARDTSTTYSYNTAVDLATVIYSDATPDVTNAYDRLGRRSEYAETILYFSV